MDFMLSIVQPDFGVFTAVDAVHSEQFGDPDAIAREEVKMALSTKSFVFLNEADAYALQLMDKISVDMMLYQTQ
jgi:UDP-N-acetylmuramyl pentapeptide synthase